MIISVLFNNMFKLTRTHKNKLSRKLKRKSKICALYDVIHHWTWNIFYLLQHVP